MISCTEMKSDRQDNKMPMKPQREKTGKRSDGAYMLSPGGTMTLRYRVLLHRGDERQGRVAEAFSVYSDEAK